MIVLVKDSDAAAEHVIGFISIFDECADDLTSKLSSCEYFISPEFEVSGNKLIITSINIIRKVSVSLKD